MKFLEPLGFDAAGTGREGTHTTPPRPPPRCLFFLMQEGSSTWKSFICTPNSAAELLRGGCSHAKTLLLLPRVTWLYGKGCLWAENLSTQSHRDVRGSVWSGSPPRHIRDTVKGLSSRQNQNLITCFLVFWSRRRWAALILNLDTIKNVFLI